MHDRGRRAFLKAASAAGAVAVSRMVEAQQIPSAAQLSAGADRAYWVDVVRRLSDPVLTNLTAGTLKARMPVESASANRGSVTHLEAVGRLLAGIAPWLELGAADTEEGRLRSRYGDLARRAIAVGVDRTSPDALNFTEGRQPLVDAAFLAHGILRAPTELWAKLEPRSQRALIAALESTRTIQPGFNNWLLFSATIEAALARMGAPWDRMRVDYALRQHEQWYKGDGVYGDGPDFHWDYYNSFVIQPMLLDVLDACADHAPAWKALVEPIRRRAGRYAAVLERLISPDGTFPPIGRSITYRFGAFQLLAQLALKRQLPAPLVPAQVRSALTAVIRRSIEAPGTFDAQGWLRIGFCGHQPGVGEGYISTGSLYLCAVGLLPLGLPEHDEFWSAAAMPWTAARAWSGAPFPVDKAL